MLLLTSYILAGDSTTISTQTTTQSSFKLDVWQNVCHTYHFYSCKCFSHQTNPDWLLRIHANENTQQTEIFLCISHMFTVPLCWHKPRKTHTHTHMWAILLRHATSDIFHTISNASAWFVTQIGNIVGNFALTHTHTHANRTNNMLRCPCFWYNSSFHIMCVCERYFCRCYLLFKWMIWIFW